MEDLSSSTSPTRRASATPCAPGTTTTAQTAPAAAFPKRSTSATACSPALHICNGLLAWKEPGETRLRPLFPAVASFTALQGQEDGEVQAQFSLNGQTGSYILTPDYQLIDIPADKAGLAWWWDCPTRIVLSVEGKWAQGFGVR